MKLFILPAALLLTLSPVSAQCLNSTALARLNELQQVRSGLGIPIAAYAGAEIGADVADALIEAMTTCSNNRRTIKIALAIQESENCKPGQRILTENERRGLVGTMILYFPFMDLNADGLISESEVNAKQWRGARAWTKAIRKYGHTISMSYPSPYPLNMRMSGKTIKERVISLGELYQAL